MIFSSEFRVQSYMAVLPKEK